MEQTPKSTDQNLLSQKGEEKSAEDGNSLNATLGFGVYSEGQLDPGRKIPKVLWEGLGTPESCSGNSSWGIPWDGRGAAPGDPPQFGEFSFPGSQDRAEAHPGFPC